jgi:MFS family permease
MTDTQKKANLILTACIFFNLSIGVLYAWSMIKTELIFGEWAWTSSQAGLPYTLAIVCFALAAFVGGWMQDKIGPRWVVTCGGVLVGLGLIISGLVGNSPTGIAIGFGVVTGAGIGFGYSCVTPPALKWFHPSKKGLVSGLIVGGFGIATVYLAPLVNVLLGNFGIEKTMIILGVATIVVSTPIAQFIKNPPAGYTPPIPKHLTESAAKSATSVDFTRSQMLKTTRFYLLFVMFLFSSSVGLMIIGNMPKIAKIQLGITDTAILAILVSFLAITNTLGRVIGGMMSDKIGRVNALFVVFILQALNMVGFMVCENLAMLALGIIVVGFSYGTLLSVFPSFTADQYGLKNYGANYGIMYLAWGLAGVAAPVIADYFYGIHQNFEVAYIICAVMMTAMIFINYILKRNLKTVKGQG